MKKLFSEFNAASAQDWKQQIIKDLKGTDFEKLIWHNANGFDVNPFYTSEDLIETPQPLFTHADWKICSEIRIDDEKTANANALKALSGGTNSLIFVVDKKIDFTVLLNEISVEHIELNFVLKYAAENFVSDFNSYLKQRNISPEKINGSISFDTIGYLVETGINSEFRMDNSELVTDCVNAALYQNSGATQSFELACALAHAHEYLVVQSDKNISSKKLFRFTLAVGSDFFGEIAKLRALRKLWTIIAKEYNANPEIYLHSETSLLNKSSFDANNNMLRTTTEGMSAVIGGCNSLTVNSYNSGFEKANDFSERMARNQQLIFKEESYLDKVADMGAGSYYIETLTDEIAAKAWEEFKLIESKGGFIACLKSNYIQEKIHAQAAELIKEFKEGQLVLIGVNKFKNPKEKQELRSKSKESRQEAEGRKQSAANTEIEPITALCLSDYLVKENA